MALMSLRSRHYVKASMVLMRDDHLFIHNYIRSLLNNNLRPILSNKLWSGRYSKTAVAKASDNEHALEPHRQ